MAASALAMVLCLCACSRKSGIEGRVVDGSGHGLAGVRVIAEQVQPVKGYEIFEAVTGPDGSFRFDRLYPSSQYVVKTDSGDEVIAEGLTAVSGPEGQVSPLPAPLVVHHTASRNGIPADSAKVVSVKEVVETVKTPREVCEDVQVQEQAPVKDPYRVTGTVIGGVAGGALGHQIGHGKGKTVATVVGAAGGAYVGNRVQKGMQEKDVVTTTRRVCKTVYDTEKKVVGYDVTYLLEGKEGVVRTSRRPGPTLPVKDGKVVVAGPETGQ